MSRKTHKRPDAAERRRRQIIRQRYGLPSDGLIEGDALTALQALRDSDMEQTDVLEVEKPTEAKEQTDVPEIEKPTEAKEQTDVPEIEKPTEAKEQTDVPEVEKPTEAKEQTDVPEDTTPADGAEVPEAPHDNLAYDEVTGLPLDLIVASNPRIYGEGLAVATVVRVNESIIPGYDVRTVRSLGVTTFVGVRSDVTISADSFQVPSIVVKVVLVTTSKNHHAFTIAIPVNAEGFTFTTSIIQDQEKEDLFPAQSALYSAFDNRPLINIPDVDDAAAINITVPRSAARFTFAHRFIGRMQRLGGGYARLATQMAAMAASIESQDVISVQLFRPNPVGDIPAWPDLSDFLFPYNPFASMIPERTTVRELTGKKIILPGPVDGVPHALPIPSTTRFYDADHHYIMLLAGVADELRYETIRSATGAETNVSVKFFPLHSPWQETDEEQLANYGQVLADGNATELLVVAQITAQNKNLLGEIGDSVVITTRGLTAESHPQPNPTDEQNVLRMATDLVTRFQTAATHAQTVVHQQHQAALRRENEDIAEGHDAITELPDFDANGTIYNAAFVEVVRRPVSDFISPEMVTAFAAANPGTDPVSDLARCTDDVITRLRRLEQETDEVYLTRIRAWVVAHPPVDGVNRHGNEGLAFHGMRIPAPSGMTLHHALYHVGRARQPGYSSAYKPPYLRITFPPVAYVASLRDFSSAAFPDTANKTRDEEADQAPVVVSPGAVIAHVSVKVDATTYNHEMAALHRMTQLNAGSDGAVLWDHVRHFQNFPVESRRDLLAVFPGLASLDGRADLPPALLDILRNTKAGKVFISGCPGSGKSRLLLQIAIAALAGSYFPRGNASITPVAVVPIDAETDAELTEALHGVDPMQSFTAANLQTPVAGPVTTAPAAPMQAARPARTGFVLHAEQAPAPVVEAPVEQTVNILYTAPSNAIVDDALGRFVAAGVTVAKAYPYSGEMANLLSPARDPRPVLDSLPMRTRTEAVLTDHRNAVVRRRAEAVSARSDPRSLSNLALAHFPEDDDRVVLIYRGRALQLTDPHGFSLIEAAAKEAATSLLQAFVGTVPVICATPVASRTLGNNTSWVPSLIFVDEAGRLTESQFAVVVSHWPHTSTIIAGDPRQFSPVVPSKHEAVLTATNEPLWQDRFGTQRELSILHRAQDSDAIDIHLTVNYRSTGNIIGWASRQFYDGEMTVARGNRDLRPEQLALMDYFRQFSEHLRFCGIFVDIEHLHETKVATSFSSLTTVRFCLELAVSLWRKLPLPRKHDNTSRFKILIISGYKVQVNELRAMAETFKLHTIPAGAIDIRTVDDAPSHEAEVVIYDLPRSSSVGFLGNPERMCVGSTRANYCTIYVGRVATLERNPLLKSLIALHRDAYALLRFPDYRTFCDNCHSYDHIRRNCSTTLAQPLQCMACTRVHRTHNGRSCQNATIVAPFDLGLALPAIDNVDREPLSGCIVAEPTNHNERAEQGDLVGAHDRTDWIRKPVAEVEGNGEAADAADAAAPADAAGGADANAPTGDAAAAPADAAGGAEGWQPAPATLGAGGDDWQPAPATLGAGGDTWNPAPAMPSAGGDTWDSAPAVPSAAGTDGWPAASGSANIW